MSARCPILVLHPLTRESIEAQGVPPRCGCRGTPDPAVMYLCDYHDGFDEGVEAHRQAVQP